MNRIGKSHIMIALILIVIVFFALRWFGVWHAPQIIVKP
jgi:hypothetical protein